MIILYRILLYLASPVVLLRLLGRALQDRRYLERLPQRFGFAGRRLRPGGVWIHAVSVGEVNAAAPLVERLLRRYPHKPVTITTMTPTGAERVAAVFAGRVGHCYLPFDYPGAVRRFLERAAPCLALVMETEIWPNLIDACHRLGVPVFYINVRMSRRSHRGYHRWRGLVRPTLQKIDHFAVQTPPDARRLIRLGAPAAAVTVTGNLKFDTAFQPGGGEAARRMREDWGRQRPVWVAGSTHEGEEAQILEVFARLRERVKALLLVVVPRHPRRFKRVFRLCAGAGYRAVLRSENRGRLSPGTDIYVADTLGELPALIAAGDIAFIGGSLVPVGGHNVLEASAAGVPVVFGRYMFNFSEIADLLLQHAAGIQVMNPGELAEVVLRLLNDPALRRRYAGKGRELVAKKRGALDKVGTLVDGEMARQGG